MTTVQIDLNKLAELFVSLIVQASVEGTDQTPVFVSNRANIPSSAELFDNTVSSQINKYRQQYRDLFPSVYPGGSSRRMIDTLAIHCAATRKSWLADQDVLEKREEIDRWHRGNGWRGFGYHGLIDRDGSAATGRALSEQGAHIKGHNETSIGFCLVGGHGSAVSDAFDENFTTEQYWSLYALLERMVEVLPDLKYIVGHNQFANKACPGFDVTELLHSDPTFNTFRGYAL